MWDSDLLDHRDFDLELSPRNSHRRHADDNRHYRVRISKRCVEAGMPGTLVPIHHLTPMNMSVTLRGERKSTNGAAGRTTFIRGLDHCIHIQRNAGLGLERLYHCSQAELTATDGRAAVCGGSDKVASNTTSRRSASGGLV